MVEGRSSDSAVLRSKQDVLGGQRRNWSRRCSVHTLVEKERQVFGQRGLNIVRGLIEEESPARPDRRFVRNRPGQSNARRDVMIVRQLQRSVIASSLRRDDRNGNQGQERICKWVDLSVVVAGNDKPVQFVVGKPVLRIGDLAVDLVTDPVIYGQRPIRFPVILSVEVCPEAAAVLSAPRPDARLSGRGISQQEIRKGIAVSATRGRGRLSGCKGKRAARVRRFARVELEAEDIRSELQDVRAPNPRKIFEEIKAVIAASEQIGWISGRCICT